MARAGVAIQLGSVRSTRRIYDSISKQIPSLFLIPLPLIAPRSPAHPLAHSRTAVLAVLGSDAHCVTLRNDPARPAARSRATPASAPPRSVIDLRLLAARAQRPSRTTRTTRLDVQIPPQAPAAMNNPFARPPQTEVSAAAQRFPDVLHTDPDLQQQQQYGYGQGQMYPQQTGGFGGAGMNGYAQGQGGSTGYGGQQQGMMQHLQTQQTGYGGGYAGGSGGMYSPGGGAGNGIQQQQQYGYTQQQQLQYTGMNSYQQPVYSPAPPVADLDPYASLSSSSFASPSPAPGQQQQQQQQPGGSLLAVPQTQSHPRDYVQESRAQLMAWDDYAWRQLDNRCVAAFKSLIEPEPSYRGKLTC